MRLAAPACGLALAAAVMPGSLRAEVVFGLTDDNNIVTFDSAAPGTILSTRAVVGLPSGLDRPVGIDFRPANSGLYSLSTGGDLYRLDDAGSTFSAVLVGNIGTALIGSNFGFDFNPVPDRLRVVNDGDQNLRIIPDSAVTIIDGAINPTALNLVAASYTNSFAGATTTTLFAIDTLSASLVRSSNPNAGTYESVGSLGLGAIASDAHIGFDISGVTGIGYFSYDASLYTVNFDSGAATLIGGIGGRTGVSLVGLTIGPEAAVVPEPATWAMMILGFAGLGLAMRRRRALA
jgi:hypothetical protein